MEMPVLEPKPMRVFKRETVMTFGKHKGLKISTILRDDPGYIVWMSENIDDIDFVEGIVEEAEDNDRADYDESYFWQPE